MTVAVWWESAQALDENKISAFLPPLDAKTSPIVLVTRMPAWQT